MADIYTSTALYKTSKTAKEIIKLIIERQLVLSVQNNQGENVTLIVDKIECIKD